MDRLDKLNKMLEADPNDSFLLFAISMEYKKREEIEDAILSFEKLKEADADYVGLYYHLAACYTEMDENDKALETYNAGISTAEKLRDQHAKSELMNAKVNLEMGL